MRNVPRTAPEALSVLAHCPGCRDCFTVEVTLGPKTAEFEYHPKVVVKRGIAYHRCPWHGKLRFYTLRGIQARLRLRSPGL